MPVTDKSSPVVKLNEAMPVPTLVPSSFTVISAAAVALIVEDASIVTPFSSKSVPSKRIYLLLSPNTILPPVRSKKAPLSPEAGAELASGMLPPFIVPAVTAPKSAERADRFVVLMSLAVMVVASMIVDTIEFDLICED